MYRRWIVTHILLGFTGCIGDGTKSPQAQPLTVTDLATTQPSYWYAMPSPATVVYPEFKLLFTACEKSLRAHRFELDRSDYRAGLLTTEPLITSQLFEPWRGDTQSLTAAQESTLGTIRRTVWVQVERDEKEGFVASPKVLVERQAVQERRITNVVLYKGQYQRTPDRSDLPRGTKESDQGINLPNKYWYALGRDTELEKKLAWEISARLAKLGRVQAASTESK